MAASTSVIILAAGDQKRWAPQGYKQMVDINGKPLIHRTVTQVFDVFGVIPWIVVNPDNPQAFGLELNYFLPKKHERIFDTLESTSPLWLKRTIVLLGDVYYTHETLSIIRDTEHKIFFGSFSEIFAVKIYAGEWKRIKDCITIARAEGGQKLWHVYRTLEGFKIDEHKHGLNFYMFAPGIVIQDFDSFENYKSFLEVRKNGA